VTDPDSASTTSGSADRPTYRVLVVDDEEPLARLVGSYLERGGFEVALAFDGPTGIDRARSVDPDIVVLDLGLPGVDGLEVCRVVRTFSDCYVIMLTARSDEVDKLVGLSVGADDYMTKPFSPRELVARVHVMLRRPRVKHERSPSAEPPLQFGALSIDREAREVLLDGAPVDLTRTEFNLLKTLASRPRMAFGRRQLIDAVWGESWVGDEHLVDVHVGHLRRKLGDGAGDPRYILTVRGIGYRMGPGR
jgi:DNA-binding response OmpR family regulator